jgi:hypothetical protein
MAACGDNLETDPLCQPVPGDPAVEIGVGLDGMFEALSDGDEMPLYVFQGSNQFVVNLAISGLAPGDPEDPENECNPEFQFSAFNGGGERMDFQIMERAGFQLGESGYTLARLRSVQIEGSTDEISALYGTSVRISVSITDALEQTVTDQVTITAIESDF